MRACARACVWVNRVFLLWKEYKCKNLGRKCLIKLVSPSRFKGDISRIRSQALPISMSSLADWHMIPRCRRKLLSEIQIGGSTEQSVTMYQNTRCHIPQDHYIHVWDTDRGFHWTLSNYVPKYTVSYSTRPLYSCTKQHASSLATPQLTSVLRVWSQVRRDGARVWAQTVRALRCASHLLQPPLRWTLLLKQCVRST